MEGEKMTDTRFLNTLIVELDKVSIGSSMEEKVELFKDVDSFYRNKRLLKKLHLSLYVYWMMSLDSLYRVIYKYLYSQKEINTYMKFGLAYSTRSIEFRGGEIMTIKGLRNRDTTSYVVIYFWNNGLSYWVSSKQFLSDKQLEELNSFSHKESLLPPFVIKKKESK